MPKPKQLETTYGREFIKGFESYVKLSAKSNLIGSKIHGSMFQKRGLPDYVYCVDPMLFATSFLGIEMKYVPVGKLPKRNGLNLTKLLRPEQRSFLSDINDIGGLGCQCTIIQLSKQQKIAVFTRPRIGQHVFFYPIDALSIKHSNELASFIFTSETPFLFLRRDPAKNKPKYDYSFLPKGLMQL